MACGGSSDGVQLCVSVAPGTWDSIRDFSARVAEFVSGFVSEYGAVFLLVAVVGGALIWAVTRYDEAEEAAQRERDREYLHRLNENWRKAHEPEQ
jgi:hypothetical protein